MEPAAIRKNWESVILRALATDARHVQWICSSPDLEADLKAAQVARRSNEGRSKSQRVFERAPPQLSALSDVGVQKVDHLLNVYGETVHWFT
jgi:hypothetical protein